MEFIQNRVEPWIRDQRAKLLNVSWGPLQWWMKWPWTNEREQKKKIQVEYERRRKHLQDLCRGIKAESVSELQEILCCMVLSECVYKRPTTELIQAVNKFKADFGGQVVSLERLQPSSDHVPDRYLLAEAGDTLFASFIGTKQYKDVIADANDTNYSAVTTRGASLVSSSMPTNMDFPKVMQKIGPLESYNGSQDYVHSLFKKFCGALQTF